MSSGSGEPAPKKKAKKGEGKGAGKDVPPTRPGQAAPSGSNPNWKTHLDAMKKKKKATRDGVCMFWNVGTCRRGDKCPWWHINWEDGCDVPWFVGR